MPKITVFTADQLEPVIAEGAGGYAQQAQWINGMLTSIAQMVKTRPVVYRSFGPFWWPIKQMMQDANLIGGPPVDPDDVAAVTMGSPALDVAAAFAYHEFAMTNQLQSNDVPVLIDGDSSTYWLFDEDIETTA